MGAIDVVEETKKKVLEGIWVSLKQTVRPNELVYQMDYVRKETFIAFLGGVMDMEAAKQRKKAIAFSDWCNKRTDWRVPKTTEELYNIWENDKGE